MSKYNELKLINLEDIRKIFVGADKEECVEIYNTLIEAIEKAEKWDEEQENVSVLNVRYLRDSNRELETQLRKEHEYRKDMNNFIEILHKRINQLEQENQILKDFAFYCINEIHKWGCCYKYTNQEVIDNISNYLNEKGIKEMLEVVNND